MQVARSRWRAEADRVIREAMETLPAGCNRSEAYRSLQGKYPFGEKAYLPYTHWRRAVRAALDKRFPSIIAPCYVHITPLGVWCDWCSQYGGGSCIACSAAKGHDPLPRVADEFNRWMVMVSKSDNVVAMLADWLLDIGAEELSATVRGTLKMHPRSLDARAGAVMIILGKYWRRNHG